MICKMLFKKSYTIKIVRWLNLFRSFMPQQIGVYVLIVTMDLLLILRILSLKLLIIRNLNSKVNFKFT